MPKRRKPFTANDLRRVVLDWWHTWENAHGTLQEANAKLPVLTCILCGKPAKVLDGVARLKLGGGVDHVLTPVCYRHVTDIEPWNEIVQTVLGADYLIIDGVYHEIDLRHGISPLVVKALTRHKTTMTQDEAPEDVS